MGSPTLKFLDLSPKTLKQLGAFALVALVALILIFAVSYAVGHLECQECDGPEKAKAIADVRTAIIQFLVAVAGGGTIYFTWRSYLRTSREARQNFALAREARTSEDFIKAIEQLGNQNSAVCAGGAFGLGRLLRTATLEGDYWPIMDVLTAYVRNAVPVELNPHNSKPPEGVQAALSVLARRSFESVPERPHDSPIDLHQTHLGNAWMASGHFEWAFFRLCLMKGVDLDSAKLLRSNFTNADLTGAILISADFEQADLRGAILRDVKAFGAKFTNADLSGVDFRGAELKDADFTGSDLKGANFSGVDLAGVRISREQAESAIGASFAPRASNSNLDQ